LESDCWLFESCLDRGFGTRCRLPRRQRSRSRSRGSQDSEWRHS
jgi:hypothetical protein